MEEKWYTLPLAPQDLVAIYKEKDDDDKGGGGGSKRGLGVPAWINSFLGMGEVEKK